MKKKTLYKLSERQLEIIIKTFENRNKRVRKYGEIKIFEFMKTQFFYRNIVKVNVVLKVNINKIIEINKQNKICEAKKRIKTVNNRSRFLRSKINRIT